MSVQAAAGPPIRFLLLVVGAWTAGRAWSVWSPGVEDVIAGPSLKIRSVEIVSTPLFAKADPVEAAAPRMPLSWRSAATFPMVMGEEIARFSARPPAAPQISVARLAPPFPSASWSVAPAPASAGAVALLPFSATPLLPTTPAPRLARWSADAFVFLRRGGLADAVEPTLGGSQALVSVRRRLSDRTAITGRLTSALADGRARQAEVAVGLGVRPVRSVPVELVAERRVALSDDGRDAWQLRAVGGGQVERGGWRLESYGQAGVVGTRSRDLFADGQLRALRPLVGPVRAGGIVAGAAQPGASRVDVGPQLRIDVPGGRAAVLVDYRVRVAGNAAPASGPSVTLAASF